MTLGWGRTALGAILLLSAVRLPGRDDRAVAADRGAVLPVVVKPDVWPSQGWVYDVGGRQVDKMGGGQGG